MGIVVLGAVFVDIKGYPLSTYIPGGRNAGRVVQVHGGVSRNIVEDIANVELRPTFVSLVDETSAGADVIKKLQSHKVDTRYMRRTEDGMGTWLAIFDNSGDVTAAISKRPDLRPIAAILDEQGDEIFREADSISLEIDMDKEVVKRTFALAEKYGKPIYAVVSNMSIAVERRDFMRSVHCFICNQQEAGILFSENYDDVTPEEMLETLQVKIRGAQISRMVVTMGAQGAVFATLDGESGWCPAKKVDVKDTTGAGDAFFAGVVIGQTYGKSMMESCEIGTRLAASVITTGENVCPRFLPSEFGLDAPELDDAQLALEF
ncbi:MAG: PfkB family carbohydrate kinase [Oscillospiraceae bacterium]|nr:PfkB family carbohydrate kinase [Oscillospiraceae bacterium]